MRIAIIKNQEVVNVIIGDELPQNGVQCDEIVCVGWTYEKGKFVVPPIVYAEEDLAL